VSGPIALVATREVKERVRAKSFRVTTAITVLAVVVAVVLPKLLAGGSHTYNVGLVGPLSTPTVQAVTTAARELGVSVETRPASDVAAARDVVRTGRLDLAVTPDAILVKRAFASSDTSKTARLVAAIAISVGLQRGLEQAGVPPSTAQRALSAPPLAVQGILPRIPNRSSQRITALYGSILLYVFLSFYGTWILSGVVEEKTSRVVEVLLAAMRPRQLLMGKVIGIGLVALAQGVLVVLVALGASAAVGSNFLRGTNVSLLLLTLMWFLLGYAFYSTLYAAAGSLVTRQEEAQTAAFPITLPLLVAYISAFGPLGSNSTNSFLTVLSYLPPTAPISMPVRVALGAAGALDMVIAVVLELVGIVLLANLAARVYSGAILRTGKRLKVREALRAQAAET
jgi:ABC-2 type transport system permease protein